MVRSEFVAQYRLALAEAHVETGDRDVAAGLLGEVGTLAASTGSARLAGEVERLVRALPAG